ncbi:uncharacterized protein F4807DRAFT_343538 [Annulohypoxylon truncatum]|uniref:uncharacterized protein n=1 Tax=Annulohypoxylon truncatum TaxID=327061 RepID=UPI002008D36B|nr:uncharacterized protein F4807DRAFT_343538 [Annulohypoxylon truncatum]KAI1212631.1 hypothetical protein F4807DRAFT_343538 [Annulohypoxylon truncatum]
MEDYSQSQTGICSIGATTWKMATTFLQYLTLPNPKPNSENCKDGTSTKVPVVYGPYDVKRWRGLTWGNLNASFGHVLRQTMREPRIRDASDVASAKTVIYKEPSVTRLVQHWNEPVVQHSLDGTGKALMATEFKEYLVKGTLHFMTNTGEGDVPRKGKRKQEPDWCVYQEGQKVNDVHINLVPGDSKPASKWKSEWIKSRDAGKRRRANLVLQQITKYMWLRKTRYGFVISEEELVPVRLSTFRKGPEAADEPLEDYEKRQIEESQGEFLENPEEDEEDPEYQEDQDIDLSDYQTLGIPFSDPENTIRTRLEYCVIPWATDWGKKNTNKLTVNLALWWLPMLAIQDSSIKKADDYDPLKQVTRDCGRQVQDDIIDGTQGDPTANPRKRKAGSSDRPARGSKSSRGAVSRAPANGAASPRRGVGQHDQNSRHGSINGDIFARLPAASRACSAGPARPAKRNRGLHTDSPSPSAVSSSQATNMDDRYLLSFTESVG